MNRKIPDTLKKYNMIRRGDRLVVGLSGGADSVALLHFLWTLSEDWELKICAAHLNHALRGEESDRDQAFSQSLCASLGIPCMVKTADVRGRSQRSRESVELAARNERYAFFGELAGDGGKIATAHTLSDSLETQLLNLIRGTGLRGLCGIPPVRGNIIRPLIECTAGEVVRYCRDNGLSFVTDSSNLTDDYARNRIRRHVVPRLAEINPSLFHSAQRTMELLREDERFMENLAEQALRDIRLADNVYDSGRFVALEKPVAGRVLRRLLRERDTAYTQEAIGRLQACIAAGTGAVQLSDTWTVRCRSGCFAFVEKREAVPDFTQAANLPETEGDRVFSLYGDRKLRLSRMDYEKFENLKKSNENLLKNAVNCDRIGKIVIIRPRKPGDRMAPAGRGCTKTLKKLFQEAGIPPESREGLAILSEPDSPPFWTQGIGVSREVRVTPEARRILLIEVWEDKGDPGHQTDSDPGE